MKTIITDDRVEIHMQSHEVDCFICGKWTEHRWSVPVVNGDIVSNDFPDELWGHYGGGQAVCEDCYNKHERGEILPTFDKDYLHLLGGFVNGAGI